MCRRTNAKCRILNYVTLKAVKIDNEPRAFRLDSEELSNASETCTKERSYTLNQTSLEYVKRFGTYM
jgi:hypothetical protein